MKLLGGQINNKDFWKGFYGMTFFLGLILIYLEIHLYRNTFIDVRILLFIILFIGLVAFIFNKQHYKRTFGLRGNFFPLVQNILSLGFISCYLVMAANYYFADKQKKEFTFKIKSKSSIAGDRIKSNRQPTIKFDYNDFEKELVFYFSETELVDKAQKVTMQIRKGAFGFDIIDDYSLIRE